MLLWGAAMAQGADDTPVTAPIEFSAEWDAALKARDVARVATLMRRAGGQMPRNKFSETPLHQLPGRHESGDALPLMQALLTHGADVHAATDHGYTALHRAAMSSCVPCVQLLLRAGASAQAASRNGTTPLHLSEPNTRSALLAAGASIAARDQLGRLPLHTVTLPSDALMGPGVDINVVDTHGFTPLHWAAFTGRHVAAEWLLAHGANPTLRSTANYAYTDGILAAEWASTVNYPAGARAYDLAKARHDSTKWSTGQFRQVWVVLDKATPRQGLFSR